MAIKLIRADETYAERMCVTGGRAFSDDGWQLAIFPQRLKDPSDPDEEKRFMVERMQARLKDEGVFSMVAIDDEIRDQDGQVRVLAYSAWHAPGKGDNADEDERQKERRDHEGWVDDGQGGKRGDGKKYPRIMDVEAWWRVSDILKTTKEDIFGEGHSDVWCK